jgi:predicted Zn finger-like uncharacterized protein
MAGCPKGTPWHDPAMSLATRCTACGTAFRVVQDQLKVSEGRVRCGRCNVVFNALEGLFDLERDSGPGALTAGVTSPVDEPGRTGLFDEGDFPPEPFDPGLVDRIDAQLRQQRDAGARQSAGRPGGSSTHRPEFADARFDSDLPAHQELYGGPNDSHLGELIGASDAAVSPPLFVRNADRRASWQRPWVRATLGASAAVLTGALLLQTANHWRDPLAARWPPARPALEMLCATLNCVLAPPHRLEDIVVESSSLARAAGQNAYQLSLQLRNRGSIGVALPWVDLSLTDADGRLVARRALSARDFGLDAAPVFAPRSEVAWQLVFSGTDVRISGYTVEVFYP